jgi:nucleotide-binding universal stress UspA family protein
MPPESPFSIVTAIDFSETGDLALEEALRQARQRRTGGEVELHVVHVITREELDAAKGHDDMAKQSALLASLPPQIWDRITAVGKAVRHGSAETKVSSHVRLGIPSEAIHQAAIDYRADLIVVGTHGRRGLQKLILGSVAESLVKIAHCPVLVVRPKNYDNLRPSDRPDPPRTDSQRPSSTPPRRAHIYTSTQVIAWGRHDSNVVPTGVGR